MKVQEGSGSNNLMRFRTRSAVRPIGFSLKPIKTAENRNLETARHLTTTEQKQDKPTMPAVTWIDLPPESSTRTSLKSFTDYMTETQDDAAVFTPSNRLCLSPETLNALDGAEKLMDDVERQLSQMQFDNSLTDDTEEDRFGLNDERLHVQNVVKTLFEKGYYEPPSRPVFLERDTIAHKRSRDKPAKIKSSKVPSKPMVVVESSPPVDECLLCKTYQGTQDKISAVHVEETKINEDKSEKLTVQKAPAISIKGPLAMQTARIVDIQPERVVVKARANIVTHECRHLEESERVDENDLVSIVHENRLEQEQMRREQRIYTSKPSLNYSIDDKENRCWPEVLQLDLEDLSLREPRILVEVDAVLEQQRNIIRRVHEATENFDRFLVKNKQSQSFDSSLKDVEDRFDDGLGDKYLRRYDEAKKVSSELGRNKTIDCRQDEGLSLSRESLKASKSTSLGKRKIDDEKAGIVNTRNSSSTELSETSNQIFQETNKQGSIASKVKLSMVEELKDAQYSESFESESSGDDKSKSKSRLESGVQLKNVGDEVTSNNSCSLVQSSTHTETKSSAGFIENLKSSQNLKENNLPVNLRQRDRLSRSDKVDDNFNSKRGHYDDTRENYSVQKQLDKKMNELRISETDDERELHNYQFDADLLEEVNERANMTYKKINENVNDVKIECKKDKSTEKLQDNPDENSQKTSHMIDSISDISFHGSSQLAKNSQGSQKISSVSNYSSELSKGKDNSTQEAIEELSTELKIEMKLSEARDNLKSLMNSINSPASNRAKGNIEQERCGSIGMNEQKSAGGGVMKNITIRTNDARRQNLRILNSTNVEERNNLPNDRSFMTMLQDNGDELQHSLEHRKLVLLRNLESCAIKSPSRGKRLFTSTIVDDADPPVNFTRSKESSTIRQDSDSNSEGEIRLNSTASHSLGEIRRKTLETKSSCSTKESTTTSSTNLNNSSSRSAGEFNGLNEH